MEVSKGLFYFQINILSFFGFQRVNGYTLTEKKDQGQDQIQSSGMFDQQKFEEVKKE